MKSCFIPVLAFLLILPPVTSWAGGEHRIGGGVHYLRTVGDIEKDDSFDENALSFSGSYQARGSGLLGLELGLEATPDYLGLDETLWQPQGYILLGRTLYAGAGIGIGYLDGEWLDDPFYAFRLGFDLEILPNLYLDINGNYRFQDSKVLDTIDEEDLDVVTFGASIRIGL